MSNKKARYPVETSATRADFETVRKKHGLRARMKHFITSYATSDSKMVLRLAPEKLLVVDADRNSWFTPVGPAKAQQAYEGQDTLAEQQEIFRKIRAGSGAS